MKLTGRPLRFLALVLGGWTALRIAVLLPEAIRLPELIAAEAGPIDFSIASLPPRLLGEWPGGAPPATPRPAAIADARLATRPVPGRPIALALLARIGFGEPQRRPRSVFVAPHIPPPAMPTVSPDGDARRPSAGARLSGSAWLSLRGDGGSSLGPGGQLGGSQGGVRLRYALGDARRLALSARVSAPTRGPGSEAALGIEWRPTDLPIALIAEQRLGLDDTASGPALMAVGGIDPRPIGGGFAVEGYAQGGAVLRGDRGEPFIDGAVRLSRPVARAGRGEVTLGLGAWGGAQRDAQRLDIGPSAAITLPIADRGVRLSLDWRQRVAGGARPGSGLALTLGSDF